MLNTRKTMLSLCLATTCVLLAACSGNKKVENKQNEVNNVTVEEKEKQTAKEKQENNKAEETENENNKIEETEKENLSGNEIDGEKEVATKTDLDRDNDSLYADRKGLAETMQKTDDSIKDKALIESNNPFKFYLYGSVEGNISENVKAIKSTDDDFKHFVDDGVALSDLITIDFTYDKPLGISFIIPDNYEGDRENIGIARAEKGSMEPISLGTALSPDKKEVYSEEVIPGGTYFLVDVNEAFPGLG